MPHFSEAVMQPGNRYCRWFEHTAAKLAPYGHILTFGPTADFN